MDVIAEPNQPTAAAARLELDAALVGADATSELGHLLEDGFFARWLPEFPALAMEQDPLHRHKDVLVHSIAVCAGTPPRLRVRMSALLHDIGKPRTRRYGPDGVTFHHHEAVDARIARNRLGALGYGAEFVEDVATLVAMSGRLKGDVERWTDAALRRLCRDAGGRYGDLLDLVRADCTTRDPRKVAAVRDQVDVVERRVRELAAADADRSRRQCLSGEDVMGILGIPPGPLVGAALRRLAVAEASHGPLDRDAAIAAVRRR